MPSALNAVRWISSSARASSGWFIAPSECRWIGSAVEQNVLTSDVPGMHAAQESAGLTELQWRTEALRGNRLLRPPGDFGFRNYAALCRREHAAAQTRGVEAARQQIVDRDALVGDPARDAGRKCRQSGTGRARQIKPRQRHFDAYRGDIDDSAKTARRHPVDDP